MQKHLKPRFLAFFLNGLKLILIIFIACFIILIVFLSIFLQINFLFSAILSLILAFFITSPFLANLYFAYKKEKYLIGENNLTKISGDFFNNSKVEIDFAKIVSFTVFKPFLRNLLFGTKSLLIQTSGTQTSIIILNDLAEDQGFLELLAQLSQSSNMDFSDKTTEIKPSVLNAFIAAIDSSWNILYSSLLYFGVILFEVLFGKGQFDGFLSSPFLILLFIYLGFSILTVIYKFFESLVRINFTNYLIYPNQVQINFGVFNKFSLFLSREKITDTLVTKSFWEKIFGLKSISLSVPNNPAIAVIQGIPNLEKINLDLTKRKDLGKADSAMLEESQVFRPNKKRYFLDAFLQALILVFAVIIGILLPELFWIILPSGAVMYTLFILTSEVFFTKYIFSKNFISREYDFLTTKNTKLSKENTTSIKITESILDKIFGTISITFFSFGGSESIRMLYVKKDSKVHALALEFLDYEEIETKIALDFSFFDWLQSVAKVIPQVFLSFLVLVFYSFIFLIGVNIWILFAVLILIVSFVGFLILNNYFTYKRAILRSSGDFLEYFSGWIFQSRQILKKEFIKDFVLIKYPLSQNGELIAHLSSDGAINSNQSIFSIFNSLTSNQISAKFFNSSKVRIQEVDHSYMSNEVTAETKPSVINSLLKFLPLAILFFPLLIFLPIIYLKIYFTTFTLEEDKIIEETGIIFRTKKLLLFSDIDHIEVQQDFLNKILGNSSILIYTSANEVVEMRVLDIRNASTFMDKVNKLK